MGHAPNRNVVGGVVTPPYDGIPTNNNLPIFWSKQNNISIGRKTAPVLFGMEAVFAT